MDVVEFAMKMEMDGKRFYEDAAVRAPQQELKDILLYLAEEELRHFNFFRRLRDGEKVTVDESFSSKSLGKTKNVFIHLIEENPEKQFGDDARAVWQEALKIEEKAVKLYTDEAAKETDAERKRLLERIAQEEQTHVYLCDNMLSFMTDPKSFADSKDFAAFKSWEGR